MPMLARIVVRAANKAESSAQWNQLSVIFMIRPLRSREGVRITVYSRAGRAVTPVMLASIAVSLPASVEIGGKVDSGADRHGGVTLPINVFC